MAAILKMPKPVTVSQMRTFLGMTGYCRQWILSYAAIIKPLQLLIKTDTPDPCHGPKRLNKPLWPLNKPFLVPPLRASLTTLSHLFFSVMIVMDLLWLC